MKFSLKPLPIEGLTSKTANDFYQLNELIRDQLEAGNFAEAIQETLPTTPQMFPDGRVVYGVDGATAIVSAVFGSTDFSFGPISNNFRYRPLDHKTVVAFGVITWTIIDHEHRTVRTLETAQTELFRRNNHRPRGWEQIYEQFAYVTPVARRALRPSKPEKNNVFAPSDVLAWKCLEKPRFFSWLVTVWYNAGKADISSQRISKEVKQMAKEPNRIDISSIPELLSLAQEVRRTNEPSILQQESEDLALLTPIKPVATRRVRGKPTSADDPLWKLVGIGHSGRGDVSENKHKYLADAYLHHKQA